MDTNLRLEDTRLNFNDVVHENLVGYKNCIGNKTITIFTKKVKYWIWECLYKKHVLKALKTIAAHTSWVSVTI